mmetsp:Transcript_27177/g.53404  ORF Transcript_27177/g.53404 Transcript_27177/m.53404 type:complete len:231 (-) Transcript_27177:24-716(-)
MSQHLHRDIKTNKLPKSCRGPLEDSPCHPSGPAPDLSNHQTPFRDSHRHRAVSLFDSGGMRKARQNPVGHDFLQRLCIRPLHSHTRRLLAPLSCSCPLPFRSNRERRVHPLDPRAPRVPLFCVLIPKLSVCLDVRALRIHQSASERTHEVQYRTGLILALLHLLGKEMLHVVVTHSEVRIAQSSSRQLHLFRRTQQESLPSHHSVSRSLTKELGGVQELQEKHKCYPGTH